jgi:hypothetical protein
MVSPDRGFDRSSGIASQTCAKKADTILSFLRVFRGDGLCRIRQSLEAGGESLAGDLEVAAIGGCPWGKIVLSLFSLNQSTTEVLR